MNKITLVTWGLLVAAGSMFTACDHKASPLGPLVSSGQSGADGGAAGTSGAAGSGPVGSGVAGTNGPAGSGPGGTGAAGDNGVAGTSGVAGTGVGAAGVGAAGVGGPPASGAAGAEGTAGTSGQAGTGAAGTAPPPMCPNPPHTYPIMTNGKCVPGAFMHTGVCACQPDIPTVCKAGCVDMMMDPDNCGCCDRACGATSTCVAGSCTAAPINIVPGAPGCAVTVGVLDLGLSIAVSGGNLYVADAGHGTIKSYPVTGGVGTIIAMGQPNAHALAVAGTTVAWISSTVGGIDANMNVIISSALKATKITGGAPVTLAGGLNIQGGIQGLALSPDGSTVYFSKDTAINSVPTAGGTVTNVGNEDHGGIPGALALSGARLSYPTGLNGDVDIMTIQAGKVASCGINDPQTGELDPVKQINCMRVARSQGSLVLTTMVSNANKAYWADGSSVKANLTLPGSPQSNENLAQSPGTDIRALALSAQNVYFAHDDVIERVALTPNALQVPIARGQKAPSSLAVDATRVYWGNNGDCSVAATGL
jgi:hypothetical protein